MIMDDDIPDIPGYVPIKEAAKLLGVSPSRMYEYVRERRLPLQKAGKTLMIPIDALQQFKPHPTGRTRRKAPDWRVYKGGGSVLATDIHVNVRSGQQERALQKLKAIQEEKRHAFTGTIARYIMKEQGSSFPALHIVLVWKDTEMPEEAVRQQEFEAFKAELADVLDWDTAQISLNEGIIYT